MTALRLRRIVLSCLVLAASCAAPTEPASDGLRIADWHLIGAVQVEGDSLITSVQFTNRSSGSLKPPTQKVACALELRVYASQPGTSALGAQVYDGIDEPGCINSDDDRPTVGAGESATYRSALSLEYLVDTVQPGASEYWFVPVLREFDGQSGLEVPPPVRMSLSD